MATSTLYLKKPQLGKITHGGYVIGYEGALSRDVTLSLGLPDLTNAMDVTGRNKDDLLDRTNLPTFLSLIGKQRTWWGGQGTCRLYVRRGGTIIAQSNVEEFPCPVRPFAGRLSPALGKCPLLRYTGTPPHYADGRFLHMPAIDGGYYFRYGSHFETDDSKRGFNCITYVGAVMGVPVESNAMSAFGTQLANFCGCAPSTGCENVTLQEARIFLKSHWGTYIMWSQSHIVIVVNGWVHEFREQLGRYNMQAIDQWTHKSARWWVRRSPKQF
jgi:hypothetical protein